MINELERALKLCIDKTKLNVENIGKDLKEYPSSKDGNYFSCPEKCTDFMHIMNWTASFFTGMELIAFDITKDIPMLKWLNSHFDLYYSKVFNHSEDTMHDLGFLYSPYSVWLYKMTGDTNNRRVALKATDELAKRFMANGGYIRAWGRMDDKINETDPERAKNHFYTESQGLAIIDCMMNLPLLLWASKETGNPYYRNIAMTHADTTLKYFIRDDFSVYHAYRFDHESGKPLGGCNYCGYSTESYWARGTTWAIYGFAIMYTYTNEFRYLDIARKLAHKFIENLDDSIIPVWDFRLPKDALKTKDTSAAAIAACGFMEIIKHQPDPILSEYADKLIYALTDEVYTDYNFDYTGVLKQSNGCNTYTIFGDYYYMEALARKLHSIDTCW